MSESKEDEPVRLNFVGWEFFKKLIEPKSSQQLEEEKKDENTNRSRD